MNTIEKDQKYIAHAYHRYPVCFVSGKGSILTDEDGKEYIDLGSGIGVDIFGIAHEPWMTAVEKQLHTLNHISNLYYTKPDAELAELLCEKTGMKKVFFSNSGAEANECAIKGARKYSIDKYGKDRNVIVTLINGFHGRTVTTLAATGQEVFHQNFFPLTEGFLYTPLRRRQQPGISGGRRWRRRLRRHDGVHPGRGRRASPRQGFLRRREQVCQGA